MKNRYPLPAKKNPFLSPRASRKRMFDQVNGETQQTQHEIIYEAQMRKRS